MKQSLLQRGELDDHERRVALCNTRVILFIRFNRGKTLRKLQMEKLKPGMVLGRSIFSDANTLLLAASQELDEHYLKRIVNLGYTYVWIEEEGFEDIVPIEAISEATRRHAETGVEKGFEFLSNALRMKSDSSIITRDLLESDPAAFRIPNVGDMTIAVAGIVRDIIDRSIALVDVFAEVIRQTYVYRHAVNVTVLSLLIGRQFGYTSRQLRELGLSAMLHDVGKACFPKILGSPKHDLDLRELDLYCEHPALGSVIVENTDRTMAAERLSILHHHEWQNGNGFPQGLIGDNTPPTRAGELEQAKIFRYAEIIAVAETYDNLVNGNDELPRRLDPADALGTLISYGGNRFNQVVCYTFSKIVALYPTGSMVQIVESDAFGLVGYYAVVKEQGQNPSRPQVILFADPEGSRVKPKSIDFIRDMKLRLKLMV